MLILALDASSLTLSCALVEAGGEGALRTLAESEISPPVKAGDALPGALLALCVQAGRSLDDVSGIAAGIGPGSFTGLRVGLAAAKGLAYARRWPAAGASSLQALALSALPFAEPGRLIIATTEARRGELYAAAYRAGLPASGFRLPQAVAADALVPEGVETVYSAAQFASFLHARPGAAVVGPGAAACAELLSTHGIDLAAHALAGAPRTPPAAAVAALCAAALRAAGYDAAALFALSPNYLKPSEAEVALGEGRVGGLVAV